MKLIPVLLIFTCLHACAGAADDRLENTAASEPPADALDVSTLLPDLKSESCQEETTFVDGVPISISAEALSLGGDAKNALTGAHFFGAWHLRSDEPNFGGLSGLTTLPDGDLLAVSDAGAFIWIGMNEGTPSGVGRIGYMRGEDGQLLSGKRAGDSEGVDLVDGVAFVSFERDHRVLAFYLASCGVNARGVLAAQIEDTPPGLTKGFRSNQGAEAIMINGGQNLVVGLETGRAGPSVSPISTLTRNGLNFDQRLARPNGPFLVGFAEAPAETVGLFRSFAPAVGNLVEVRTYKDLDDIGTARIRLARPYTVDNFEGVAVTPLSDGNLRVYLVSDDNFSSRQRTLLMAFDLIASSTF